ncbi:MAG: hypothetical protein JSU65_02960 [Candidatus Zixiibacteriota bacterium]|nr:MAG: hypothetical protein JSU65_02960 [candidate division Zixibacteria bacterium]
MYRIIAALFVLFAAAVQGSPQEVTSRLQPGIGFSSGYRSRGLEFDRRPDELLSGDAFTSVSVTRSRERWRWRLDLTHRRPHGEWTTVGKDGLVFKLPSPEPSLSSSLSFATSSENARARMWYTALDRRSDEIGFQLYWQPLRVVAVGTDISTIQPLPRSVLLTYRDEGGWIDFQSKTRGFTYWLEIRASERARLYSSHTSTSLTADDRAAESEAGQGYAASLDGPLRSSCVALTVPVGTHEEVSLSYRELSTHFKLLGFKDGLRFAHFGVVDAEARMYSVNIISRLGRTSLMFGDAHGDFSGSVEAWPFAEGLARFIGERRHLVARGDLSWRGGLLSRKFRVMQHFRVCSELVYVWVQPDIRHVTWRPIAFGFGMDDLRSGSLSVLRAQILRIKINPQMTLGRFSLSIGASQWIPLEIKRTGSSQTAGGGSTEPGEIEPEVGSSSYNGFSFSISLSCSL